MYFGSLEIESVEGNLVTLKNGTSLEVTEKNKELFTEEAITWTDLQDKWQKSVVPGIVDLLAEYNVRLADINAIFQLVGQTIQSKNEEALVKAFGKEKLGALASVFGASSDVAELNSRSIRVKDIF